MLWVLGLVFIAMGIAMLAFPDLSWELTHMGNQMQGVESSKRTEMWEFGNMVSGIILIGVGLATFWLAATYDSETRQTNVSLTSIANMSNDMSTQQIIISQTSTAETPWDEAGIVTNVIDGDTIEVEIDGEIRVVRYIGVNAPPLNRPCGEEAASMNRELVLDREVQLYQDTSDIDQDERLLRYVYVDDIFVNLEIIRRGYAAAVAVLPDIDHYAQFQQAESEAVKPCAW